jgi:hypothetical protein
MPATTAADTAPAKPLIVGGLTAAVGESAELVPLGPSGSTSGARRSALTSHQPAERVCGR